MKRLNYVGRTVAEMADSVFRHGSGVHFVAFFNGRRSLGHAGCLGPARMFKPGTVAVSSSGRQWVAVGGDKNAAQGWSFVSPYVERDGFSEAKLSDNPKALKIRAKLDAYLDYFQECKGVRPRSAAFRREQLEVLGVMPGEFYKGVRLEAFS